ncbi:hypothetical protein DOTSEDRAFT_90897 [Dothistroma septosporum NZE10]|uniref:Uncharacterized protein n=1 Tax=Dothistroma septosporum (strain NZE10 / CBS 128990) TaxID=675120 RepID=N1PEK5_DOTSN|nr:hypothetical protein DOTSEDRAFT_90897 [Dothistroma septosporum NZE10]
MASNDDSDDSDKTEHGKRHDDKTGSKNAAGENDPGLRRPDSQLSGIKIESPHLSVSEPDSVDTDGIERGDSSGSRLDRARGRGGGESESEERIERRRRVPDRISIKRRLTQISVPEQRVYSQRPRRNGNTLSRKGRKRSARDSPVPSRSTHHHTHCIHDLETRGTQQKPSTSIRTSHSKSRRNEGSVPPKHLRLEHLTLLQSTKAGGAPHAEDCTDILSPDQPSSSPSDGSLNEDGTVDPFWKQQRANLSKNRDEGPNEPRPVEDPPRPDIFARLNGRDKVESFERVETNSDGVPGTSQGRAGSLRSWTSWYEEVGKEEEDDQKDEDEGEENEADEDGGIPHGDDTFFDDEDPACQTALCEDGNRTDEEDEAGVENTIDDAASPNQNDEISEDDFFPTARAPKDKDPNVHERDLRLVRAYASANGRLAFNAVVQIRLMRALTQIRQPTSRDQYQNAYECAILGLDLAKLALVTDTGQEDIDSLSKIIVQAHYYAGLASYLAGPGGFERALEHLRWSLDYSDHEDATGRTRAEQVINNILQYQQDPLSVGTGPDYQKEPPKSIRWAWIRGTIGSISSMASSFFRSPYEDGVFPEGRRLESQMLDGEVSPGQASSLESVSAVDGAVIGSSSATGIRKSLYIPPHNVSQEVSVGIGSGVLSVRSQTVSSDSDKRIEEAKPTSRRMTLSTDSTGRSGTFLRPTPQHVNTAPGKFDGERSSSAKVGAVRSESNIKDGDASAMPVAPHGLTRSKTKSIEKTQAISTPQFKTPIVSNSNNPSGCTKTAAIPTTITEEHEFVSLEHAHGVRSVENFSNDQFGKAQEQPGAASRLPKLHSPGLPPEWKLQLHDGQLATNEERPYDQSSWSAQASKFDDNLPLREEPEDYPQGFYEAGFHDAQYVKPIDERSWQMEDFVLPVQRMGLDLDYFEGQRDEDRAEDDVIRKKGERQQKERMARKAVFPKLEQIFREFARETMSVMIKTLTREEMFEYCNDDCHEGCREGCRDANHMYALLRRKAWNIMCHFMIEDRKGPLDRPPPMPPPPGPPSSKAKLVVVNITPTSPQMPPDPRLAKAKLGVVNTSPISPLKPYSPHYPARYLLAVGKTSPREYNPVSGQKPRGSSLNKTSFDNTIVSSQTAAEPRSPKAKQTIVVNEPPQEPISTAKILGKLLPHTLPMQQTGSSAITSSSISGADNSTWCHGSPPCAHTASPPSIFSSGSMRTGSPPRRGSPRSIKFTLPSLRSDLEDEYGSRPSPTSPLAYKSGPLPSSSPSSPARNGVSVARNTHTPSVATPNASGSVSSRHRGRSSILSDSLSILTGMSRGAMSAEDDAEKGESPLHSPSGEVSVEETTENIGRPSRLSFQVTKQHKMIEELMEEGESHGVSPQQFGERESDKRWTV